MRVVKIKEAGKGNTFEIRVQTTLEAIINENKNKQIVKLDVTVNSVHSKNFTDEYDYVQETIKKVFKNKVPAYSILFSPICDDSEFTMQYQIYDMDVKIQYKTLLKHPYVTAESENGIEIFSGGISFQEDSLLFSAQRCFDLSEQILMAEDMNFGHIHQQWNYIPTPHPNTDTPVEAQDGLQLFNEVQNFYYEPPLFVNGKPLARNRYNYNATLLIDFIAFAVNNDVVTTKEIPKAAMDWVNDHPGLNSKQVVDGKNELWFTSSPGNKLAADNEAIGKSNKDIEQQTLQSLKSIVSLKDSSHTHLHTKGEFSYLKVTVDQREDYTKVEELIKSSLPGINVFFVNGISHQSDVLVELEGLII
ncbi:hypothetical protein SAMN06265379_10378 [Saccharicrinis carchari]|uniref:Uncharacterized protein n=1 Tax=Saccharicrinis carchari TaxID=1168039 RepID=A0A521CH12_SACCC|nr:hypothetical protein [Saccharicrinis carchari]SMO58041.1 hypothetical protein SAMN06265379_10378 [Saccharicrinis carchari]